MAIQIAYKAVMSRGDDVALDPHEVEVVAQAAATGQLVRVRQGLINPSYLISIVEDKERKGRFLEDTRHEPARRGKGMEQLADIFASSPLRLTGPKP